MTLTKTQIQNLLGVSRSWVNKRVEKHLPPNSVDPTHSELVAMVREWKEQKPTCQERARWTAHSDNEIMFTWCRPDFCVLVCEGHPPHIFVRGVRYSVTAIASRFLDGWPIDGISSDYKCDRLQIEAAIAFELKARGT